MTISRYSIALSGALLLAALPRSAGAQTLEPCNWQEISVDMPPEAEGGGLTVCVSAPDSAQFGFGAGGYDIIGNNTASAGIFRSEYRFDKELWVLRPLVGIEVTTNESTYAYGGFGIDVYFGNNWVLTPNGAVGFWTRGSEQAKNLGSWVEFRTGAEFDHRFDDHSRLGVSFHHISNAGLTNRNPGEEEALIIYSIPLRGAL